MNQNALRARLLRWEWLLVALIVVVAIINTRLSPFFLNGNNLLRTTSDFMEIGIMMLPMVFIIIIPAIAAMLPGVDLNAKLALVPILNVSLLCKELVIGTYHWNFIAIIFTSTCAYAAVALFLAVKMFQRESVLFRS